MSICRWPLKKDSTSRMSSSNLWCRSKQGHPAGCSKAASCSERWTRQPAGQQPRILPQRSTGTLDQTARRASAAHPPPAALTRDPPCDPPRPGTGSGTHPGSCAACCRGSRKGRRAAFGRGCDPGPSLHSHRPAAGAEACVTQLYFNKNDHANDSASP